MGLLTHNITYAGGKKTATLRCLCWSWSMKKLFILLGVLVVALVALVAGVVLAAPRLRKRRGNARNAPRASAD